MKQRISEAVILMAGCGSRLRGANATFLKPLTPVLGQPLVSYTITALGKAGINKIVAVVGFEATRLRAALPKLVPPGIEFRFVENPEWQKQNGISLLAAANHLTQPFLLTMSDHLFEKSIVDLLIRSADLDQANLAVDRKIDSIFDLEDTMKVQTRGDRVVAIGKDLSNYDAIDTGLFVCPLKIFEYFRRAQQNGDCSLADGIRSMARDGDVRAVDIGERWWQDIDTPEMLRHAEEMMQTRWR
jgi:choline kinase